MSKFVVSLGDCGEVLVLFQACSLDNTKSKKVESQEKKIFHYDVKPETLFTVRSGDKRHSKPDVLDDLSLIFRESSGKQNPPNLNDNSGNENGINPDRPNDNEEGDITESDSESFNKSETGETSGADSESEAESVDSRYLDTIILDIWETDSHPPVPSQSTDNNTFCYKPEYCVCKTCQPNQKKRKNWDDDTTWKFVHEMEQQNMICAHSELSEIVFKTRPHVVNNFELSSVRGGGCRFPPDQHKRKTQKTEEHHIITQEQNELAYQHAQNEFLVPEIEQMVNGQLPGGWEIDEN